MPRLCGLLFSTLLFLALVNGSTAAQDEKPVDLALVLAADVSGSMDAEESRLQRDGYLRALAHPRVIDAIRSGPHGRIAITYMEWSGIAWQRVIAPWTIIYDEASARSFVSVIAEEPIITERRTSISAALDLAVRLIEDSPYESTRKVIDISGDGPNNQGRPILAARDEAMAKGITINGLPVMSDRPNPWGGPPAKDLDLYYEEFVIGGHGAFMIPVTGFENFFQGLLSKLIREIADLPGPVRESPELYRHAFLSQGGLQQEATVAPR